jgi:hypothetical protein
MSYKPIPPKPSLTPVSDGAVNLSLTSPFQPGIRPRVPDRVPVQINQGAIAGQILDTQPQADPNN